MDRDTADLVADELALAGVQAASNVEAEIPDGGEDRKGAHDRASWAVESGEESVAGVVDLATAEAVELSCGTSA